VIPRLGDALIRLEADLRALSIRWALVGGLAVSSRVEPRVTKDVDVAIAVRWDREAERLVADLIARGYGLDSTHILENEVTGRLATVRLFAPGQEVEGAVVDLLFVTSGIEPEVVGHAKPYEVLPGLVVPLASVGHLIALKLLAGRLQDWIDAERLFEAASEGDLAVARQALDLMTDRGYDRGEDLRRRFAALQAGAGWPPGSPRP
jgi:predicted nucleotidyltransferase